VKVKKQ